VVVDCPKSFGGLAVQADREQIARTLTNLLRNAVQAMRGTGQISIRASQQDAEEPGVSGCVVLEIEDDGPGIPASHRESVFEPLVTGRPNGIGLGLAIAKRYARRNHGDLVLVKSPVGALFRLTLPSAASDPVVGTSPAVNSNQPD
jgi:signal transduction histidine kinase